MKRRRILFGCMWGCILLLNLLAWCSHGFCDFYVTYIFPLWIHTYGRLTGLCAASVGEWMLYLFAALILLSFVFLPVWLLLRKRRQALFFRRFYLGMAYLVTVVCVIMTLNCILLYHCSTLDVQAQESGSLQELAYWEEELGELENEELLKLIAVRELVVTNLNRLAGEVAHDESGSVIYEGDMKQEAIAAVRALGAEYPRLLGYYPRPKPLAASWFFSQQYMCGYYFPFSMEANYNDMMYLMNIPYTMCHELTHLKGYIYEDEANFLAYLACIRSSDAVFEYSGYLGVLYYVENDLYEALKSCGCTELYQCLTPINGQVVKDDIFLTSEAWEEVEESSVLSTEFVSDVTDQFLETNLTINGVADGVISYSRVVELMLAYYQ